MNFLKNKAKDKIIIKKQMAKNTIVIMLPSKKLKHLYTAEKYL